MGLVLIRGISQLLTLQGAWKKAGRRIQSEDLGVITKAAVLIAKDQIVWVGPEAKLRGALTELNKNRSKKITVTREYDAKGQTVLPGWIDCHTHTVFAGNRWNEFEMRCQGATYQEIAQSGGGILSTMRDTRAVSKPELLRLSQKRIDNFLAQGVTTVEVKSGYALELKGELKQLEVARQLKGPRVVTTFLGAHAKPPEFLNTESYLQHLTEVVLPQIKKKRLADRVDIFIESNFFEVPAAQKYLQRAKDLGFALTIHADQLSLSGGTRLAVELGAQSADHVIQLSDSEIDLVAHSETTAVLLPMADLYMKCAYPPARQLIERGARVALATDFNPGSCPSQDVQLVGLLARLHMKMSLPEIISAWTVGAAHALGLNDVGTLQKGFRADLQIIDKDWQGLFYEAGANPVSKVFVGGKSKVQVANS
jgi:imidazolonepropionase